MARSKLTRQQVARFCAIRNAIKAKQANATVDNDNAPVRSAYVNTTMTAGMLAACVAAAGY